MALGLKLRVVNSHCIDNFFTYGREFAAHAHIVDAVEIAGLKLSMALNANDTDTIKTYAMSGLGVVNVAHTAYEAK